MKKIPAALALSSLFTLVACSQEKKLLEVTEKTVAVTEDALLSADGAVELRFPAGALAAPTNIRITIKREAAGDLLTPVYDFEPDGLIFQKPVQLVFHNAERPNSVIAQIDQGNKVLLESSAQDLNTKKVTAELAHFSSYALLQLRDPCGGLDCGDSCVWCDPAIPGCVEPPGNKVCSRFGFCVIDRPGLMCPITGQPDATTGDPDATTGDPDATVSGTYEEVEPNNTSAQANDPSIGFGTTVIHGAITPTGDVDRFIVVVPQGRQVDLTAITSSSETDPTVCADGTDTFLRLFDSTGVQLANNDDRNRFCSQIDVNLSAGTYYIEVSHFISTMTIASYYLHVTMSAAVIVPDAGLPPDATTFVPDSGLLPDSGIITPDAGLPSTVINEVEPNDPMASAQAVPAAQGTVITIDAAIDPAGEEDFFAFTVPAGQTVTLDAYTYANLGDINSCTSDMDTWLDLMDSANVVITSNDDDFARRPCSRLLATIGEGDYVIHVRHFAPNRLIAHYFLDISL